MLPFWTFILTLSINNVASNSILDAYLADPTAVNRASTPVTSKWFENAEKYDQLKPASSAGTPSTDSTTTTNPIQHPSTPTLPTDMEPVTTLIIKYMSLFRSKEVNLLIQSVRKFYPTIQVIVGDDTHERKNPDDPPYIVPEWATDTSNTKLLFLPEDCGLSLGRNILVQSVQTPYFVLLDDDFLFTKNTRLEKFLGVLLNNPTVAIVGGGLTKPTSGFFSYGLDLNVVEHSHSAIFTKTKQTFDSNGCRRVDATFNFFMARTSVLQKLPWNPVLKIQEHEALFLMLKMAGGVNIIECPQVHIFHNNKKNCKNCEIDTKAIQEYNKKSHRMNSALYSQDICKQFPNMNVLRSLYWSIVCDRSTYCERQPDEKLQRVRCTAFKDGDDDIYQAGWRDTKGEPTNIVQVVAQPVQMAGLDLLPPIMDSSGRRRNRADLDNLENLADLENDSIPKYDVFLAVITWGGSKKTRTVIRRFLQQMVASVTKTDPEVQIGFRFFVGNLTQKYVTAIQEEVQVYNDIVQLPSADDGYNNLLSKVTAAMRWAVSNVQADYIVKIDDDVFLNVPELVRHIKLLNMPKVRLYAGKSVSFGFPIIRDKEHKWGLPYKSFYGQALPRYNNGPCYVVSADVADYIGRYQSLSSQFEFRLEDVFMGTILSNIDVFAQLLSLPNPMEKDWFYRTYHGHGTYDRSQFMVLNLYPEKIIWSNQNKAPVLAYHSVKHPNQSFPILNQLIGFVPSLNQYVSGGMWDLGAIKNFSVDLAMIEKDTNLEIDRLNGKNPCCCYWFIWWWCTWVYSKPVFLMNVCIHLSVSCSLLYGIKLYLSWQKCCCFTYEKKNYIFEKQKSIV